MGDRDNPTVPVTTLAGLTSTSDLLSELPVADSLQSAASLNKSLLFHALVANEANNLLSMRNENLVRQLVTAIERTNSDNIELINCPVEEATTNCSTYPELLQGIYHFRPAVFNTSIKIGSPNQHPANLRFEAKKMQIDSYSIPECYKSPTNLSISNEDRLQSSQACINHLNSMTSKEILEEFSQINFPTEKNKIDDEIQNSDLNVTKILTPNTPKKKSNTPERSTMQSIQEQFCIHQQETNFNLKHDFNQVSANVGKSQNIYPTFPHVLDPSNFNLNSVNIPNVLYVQSPPFTETETTQTHNSSIEYLKKKTQTHDVSILNPQHLLESTNLHMINKSSTYQTNPNVSTTTSTSTSSSGKSQVRVCINRLSIEDSRLMQQSIKKFVQKSPELARSMGLLQETCQQQHENLSSLPMTAEECVSLRCASTTNNTVKIPIDTFSTIKADEKRFSAKRKLAISIGDIPPEQIFSKPKMRRVERITPHSNTKCVKEEVTRSQTYQQFIRNMDHIIEILDDSESPNFDSEDVDETIECISSKLLNSMSTDVAKLKAKQALDSIPKNKLTLLINYAMRNVYLARNYFAGTEDEEEFVDDEVIEKLLNAMDACLLICNIYSTVSDLQFLQEDNVSHIIKFTQFQLRETIFPLHDPVYTAKSVKRTNHRKKIKSHQAQSRSLQLFYSKTVELLKVFVTLFDKCVFVDTIVLPLSTLAIEPFFVDNIETLQFVCLELVTTIFRKERYDKIRNSILGDILTSIDRLPSSKKNLRPYKLTNSGGNIQMVTALVLQLIQCATILPDSLCDNGKCSNKPQDGNTFDEEGKKMLQPSQDLLILQKYDVAVSIGGNFLTTFLNKCKSRSNETDFRPLFENFIHDLLATVNKPEWPASELLLSLLGTMLVRYVSDKGIEQSIRLVSLDYLGIVAARLRKDTVQSRCRVNIIDSMIKSIKLEQEKEGDVTSNSDQFELEPEEQRTDFLQKILLDFLAVNAQEENLIWDYARHFYLAQWYRDVIYQRRRISDSKKGLTFRKSKIRNNRRTNGEYLDTSDSGSCDESETDPKKKGIHCMESNNFELNINIFKALEARKQYFINKIKPFSVFGEQNHSSNQHIKTYIDYNNAQLIAQYLATKRPFSQSFDGCLKKIILVVNEPSIAVRTRAMKCLANIVEVDPLVLKRKDMQMGVNQKFLDTAISVREAAVDLVGKFVLSNQDLIDQYYDMLSTRILDTGVSVRKRVIKILRDICLEYPDFAKIPEICVKMIRRVHDEEGIQKLVTEVFMKMWFTPCIKNDKIGIQRKINHIIDVVNTAHDTGTTWLEGLLMSIFRPRDNMLKSEGCTQEFIKKNTEPPMDIVIACQQLADGLVDRLIELEDTDNSRMLGCITTLHLLAKVRPQLLVKHAITIEPYLNIKCHSATAAKFICAVADILEKVVPLVNNASESFLASLEEHLMLLVVSRNQAEVTSCVSCLGALVNKITHNFKLIRDCFQKFYRVLDVSRSQVIQGNNSVDNIYTPSFRRSLFTIGILMRYFDFKSPIALGETNEGLPVSICEDVFHCLMFFCRCTNQEIRKQALISLGSFCVLNDGYLTRSELKNLYCEILSSIANDAGFKIICMRNIWIYLTESEMFMHNKEKEWEKQSKHEDLKEMNDVSSGMASRIIQLYLEEILECFLNRDDTVRLWAVKVIQIVLRQGLVHPVRMVPYLICLSTDHRIESAHRADALLKDIDKTYSGFVNMKVQFGLQLCFKLQKVLQINDRGKMEIIRGYANRGPDNTTTALNDFLYTLLRTTKPQRRALVQTVTKQFDDQKTSLQQMLYIADNLAYFPYVVQDEPLYLIHQIDLLISMAGTHLLATFKEHIKPSDKEGDVLEDDDDVEDPQVLFNRLPEDMTEIIKCITSAQACMLLLILKDHLKEMYAITDSKISRYSPSEQKLYEKAVTRKSVTDFNPKTTIDVIKKQMSQEKLITDINFTFTKEEKLDLVVKYLDFKQLMLKLDPDDGDSDADESRDKTILNISAPSDGAGLTNSTKNSHTAGDGCSLNVTDVVDVSMSNIAKSSILPSKTSGRKTNHVRSKKKRKKIDSTDDENSDAEYA
ncbi:nipped-B protein isoform X1 [Drosophila erecta]|uniref:nipped-B protein isoform X1 n=1 Tax=Drosophila erecta TaxID=7220 RepID=UPI000F04FB09|nr:nipped-B protein isoform X1 [Drosophila erecta]XP_026838707.1 nipped-B protein isoform X1 [Drosophila erecta]XP_026838708.1 nipped-B protein isoform X1 [Drosophila erecta]XP_026838709.1 nipped-B protein isoform X1 [Drosophila erecta]